jgi:hypothetical protein
VSLRTPTKHNIDTIASAAKKRPKNCAKKPERLSLNHAVDKRSGTQHSKSIGAAIKNSVIVQRLLVVGVEHIEYNRCERAAR